MDCIQSKCPNPLLTYLMRGKPVTMKWCREHWAEKSYRPWNPDEKPDGERKVNDKGYAYIRVQGRFISEHKIVMERMLGRPLRKGESVHHKNGIRDDNSEDNLELWVGPARNGVRAADLKCGHCGHGYFDE